MRGLPASDQAARSRPGTSSRASRPSRRAATRWRYWTRTGPPGNRRTRPPRPGAAPAAEAPSQRAPSLRKFAWPPTKNAS